MQWNKIVYYFLSYRCMVIFSSWSHGSCPASFLSFLIHSYRTIATMLNLWLQATNKSSSWSLTNQMRHMFLVLVNTHTHTQKKIYFRLTERNLLYNFQFNHQTPKSIICTVLFPEHVNMPFLFINSTTTYLCPFFPVNRAILHAASTCLPLPLHSLWDIG